MKTLNQYIKLAGQTSGTRNTQESRNASNAIGRAIKKAFPDCQVTHSVEHFCCCGFIRRGEKVIYYSFSDYRYFDDSAYIRTVDSEKDYNGGNNYPITSNGLVKGIESLFKVMS